MVIELTKSELTVRAVTPAQFMAMPVQQKRWLASQILRSRGDATSHKIAYKIEGAIPSYSEFSVLDNL
jgi:hypothetical protein